MAAQTFEFDPAQVAHYEVEGWKAYYDRAWLKLLRLVVALAQEQFHIPFPISLSPCTRDFRLGTRSSQRIR
ncbi:MAG: hypothetical protein H0X30_34825 [Anaerolineae bacterium]|nr:hypothetical protein [Anaerolineae bacterium]